LAIATIGVFCVIVGATSGGVSGLDGIVDRVILAHFLGNAEVEEGVFLSEAGGRISIIGVVDKCCVFGQDVGSSSVCLSTATSCCNENSSRLVCLVPGWLPVIRFLF
jgi:hypothetical protein